MHKAPGDGGWREVNPWCALPWGHAAAGLAPDEPPLNRWFMRDLAEMSAAHSLKAGQRRGKKPQTDLNKRWH